MFPLRLSIFKKDSAADPAVKVALVVWICGWKDPLGERFLFYILLLTFWSSSVPAAYGNELGQCFSTWMCRQKGRKGGGGLNLNICLSD